MTTAELLCEGANLMNRHGLESQELKTFIEKHNDNEEFTELMLTAMRLRKSFDRNPTRTTGWERPFPWLYFILGCILITLLGFAISFLIGA